MPGEPITRRGRASRERIVERAAELFAERGIAATSLDEVIAAAGAGKGKFYHYFRSRDELAAAAVGYRCTQVVAGLTQALGGVSSLAGLEHALDGFIAGFEQTGMPGCPIGTLATEVAGRNEDARLQGRRRVRRLGTAPGGRPAADAPARRAAGGHQACRAGHGAAGQHRGRDGAQPGPQGDRAGWTRSSAGTPAAVRPVPPEPDGRGTRVPHPGQGPPTSASTPHRAAGRAARSGGTPRTAGATRWRPGTARAGPGSTPPPLAVSRCASTPRSVVSSRPPRAAWRPGAASRTGPGCRR